MNQRWGYWLIGPFLLGFTLLAGSQFMFLKASFFADLGFGKTSATLDFSNYVRIVTEPYFLRTLWLTTYISAIVAAVCIVVGFPIAHVLARLRSRWTTVLLSAIVLTSFVTIVIQIFGLIIIFRADGPVNRILLAAGIVERPFPLIGSVGGVVVGLVYSAFGFAVMLMFSVARSLAA